MEKDDVFYPLGDCAVVIKLGHDIDMFTHRKIVQLSHSLDQKPFIGMMEWVATFTTVTVYYDPSKVWVNGAGISPYQVVCDLLKDMLLTLEYASEEESNVVNIPVCYGDDFGPDLAFVAEYNGMEVEEVIRIHTNGIYPVFMIGFAPGFPYLGGMSEKIAAPRRSSPRKLIPAGSVGIAGRQTGIYPIETPGGWQLIGRTPIPLFRPQSNPPSLLKAGDSIRFYRISREEFVAWREETS